MIVITDTDLEDVLKNLLQRQLTLSLNNKTWREGKLLLFKQSGFYLEFIINSKKKSRERFEIPIPFCINTLSKNHLQFNYKLTSLSGKNDKLLRMLKEIKPLGKSKFYDNVLEVKFNTGINI